MPIFNINNILSYISYIRKVFIYYLTIRDIRKPKMKRKIIKQGHGAFTLTLPNDWVKRMNMKAKDEVDVLEEGNQLIINAKKNSDKNSVSLDISDLPIPIIWKYFCAVYREGYDEIIVKFSDPYKKYENAYGFATPYSKDSTTQNGQKTVFPTIHDIVNRFIGIEIIDFKNNTCVIRQMEEPSDKQFESSIRRIFLIIDQFFLDLISAIEKSDFRVLEETHLSDVNLDRFHDFCCRILNKTGSRSPGKSQIIFSSLYLLEMLADEFKHISIFLLNRKKIADQEILLKFCKGIYNQFKIYEKLYFKFDHSLIKEAYEDSFNLFKNSIKLYKKEKEPDILYHLRKISEYIYSLTELRLEMEY